MDWQFLPNTLQFKNWLQTLIPDDAPSETAIEVLSDYTIWMSGPVGIEYLLDPNAIAKHGWYISSVEVGYQVSDINLHRIQGKVLLSPPIMLYHVTLTDNILAINSQGLLPKVGQKRHMFRYPPRIYLTNNPGNQTDIGLKFGDQISVLQINARQLSGVTFYEDPEFEGDGWSSCYVEVPIPAKDVQEIARFSYSSGNLARWAEFLIPASLPNPLEVGFTMPSKFQNFCGKQYGGCGQSIEIGDIIILVKEQPRIWLHEACGEVILERPMEEPELSTTPTPPAPPIVKPIAPSWPYTVLEAEQNWRKASLALQRQVELHGKSNQFSLFQQIENNAREKLERMKQLWQDYKLGLLPSSSETCFGLGMPPGFLASRQPFTFWVDPDFTIPFTYKTKENKVQQIGTDDPFKAKEWLARYQEKCDGTLYIKGEAVKAEPATKPLETKPRSKGPLPSFPSKGSGEFQELTLDDWKKFKDAYLQAGVNAKIFVPDRWRQYALLIDNRIRVSTTIDVRAGQESREKGVNAIDIAVVRDPSGPPIGGRTKVLRVEGWRGRLASRINSLL